MSYLLLNSGGGSRLQLASGDLLLLAELTGQLSVTAPASARGKIGVASGNFTFSIAVPNSGDTVVTPTSSIAGTWSPATVTLNAGTLSATATFTPSAYGEASISATGTNGAVTAAPVTYKSDSFNYYISSTGNNSADGVSTSTPWQTIAKVLSWGIVRGATYHFQGGSSFEGVLLISDDVDGSDAADLITLTSYGTGLASLTRTASSTESPVRVYNCGGVKLDRLKIIGAGSTIAASTQLLVHIDIASVTSGTIYNLTVNECEIYNGKRGIWLRGETANALKVSGITISNNSIHDVWHRGINIGQTYASTANGADAVLGLVISGNHIYDCDESTQPDISAIVWSYTTDALVVGNLIHDMGGAGTGNGMFNWGLNVRSVMRGNEVYNIFRGSVSAGDAVGLNLDSGAQDCIVEYNYVHDNQGMGMCCYSYASGAKPAGVGDWTNNTFRYNVVQNCGTERFGAFVVLGDDKDGCDVYNNTFIQTSTVAGTAIVLYDTTAFAATLTKNFHFYNNIFYAASDGVVFINMASSTGLQADTFFVNNLYYPVTGTNQIKWFGTDYSTIAAWVAAATNKDTGAVTVDPALSDAFTATVFDDPTLISTLTKVTPTSAASPVVDVGIDLTACPYSYTGITRDFAGNPPLAGAGYDIGAIEFGSTPAGGSSGFSFGVGLTLGTGFSRGTGLSSS